MFDVLAVNLKTNKVRIFGTNKTEQSAEAIVKMSIMRRGLDEEFYAVVRTGKYAEGDAYDSKDAI